MQIRLTAVLAAAALGLGACSSEPAADNQVQAPTAGAERMVASVLLTPDARDVHSYAVPAEARVTHVSLDLEADFAAKVMRGSATLDVLAAEGAQQVILDTRDLNIASVTNTAGQPLQWQMGEARDALHGAPLMVQLNGAKQIKVNYASAPGAAALQWLSPEQTADKRQPFLFSQGQAILNRTWIPTQDSPGIRQTWDARIVVPDGITATMSGEGNVVNGGAARGEPAGEGKRAFAFRMDKPVAPYLIAIAAGDIAFKPTGPRSGVWAEPSQLERVANEFSETEAMIKAAEGLYGPYEWGRYDVLVLPPSFPFGGMENPLLTFATPTVVAGDKSLTSLVAHELAHSWSGNLVTNATWNDFWLNEGFTSYFENRIMETIYGRERAAMEADLAWTSMQESIADVGGLESADTQLQLNLGAERDPDEGMTQVAYDKGATFLRTIERAVGRERFDAYLKGYFARHAFQPMTSAGFLADIRQHLFADDPQTAQTIGLDAWVYQPGLPANAVHIQSPAFPAVDAAAKTFAAGGQAAAIPNWGTTWEMVRFLDQLPREMTADQLAALDQRFSLNAAGNSEIRFAWLKLALANQYAPATRSAEQFLTSMGRRKFVQPLFQILMEQGSWGQTLATRIYRTARPGYHSVTTGTVDPIVGYQAGSV